MSEDVKKYDFRTKYIFSDVVKDDLANFLKVVNELNCTKNETSIWEQILPQVKENILKNR